MTWVGGHALTTLASPQQLQLDEWVAQRQATFRFALTNRVTGEVLGDITPIRDATLTHDTTRTTKRQLTLNLGTADTAAINTITDQVAVSMLFPGSDPYPLGRYMFAGASRHKFTTGRIGQMPLTDEMFLVDQVLTAGISGIGKGITAVIMEVLAGLPISARIDAAPFVSAQAWGVGTGRGQVLEALSVAGDYWSPWFDNNGVLRFMRTFNPATHVPDIDLDAGARVYQASILETDDLLTAPNTFVVISNAAADPSTPVVGTATVPPNAPHSVINRGFTVAKVEDLQLADQGQATAVAQGLAQRQTVFERVTLTTPPDPRHDSYNVIKWQGDRWLELGWSMQLVEGGSMTHTLRRSYGG